MASAEGDDGEMPLMGDDPAREGQPGRSGSGGEGERGPTAGEREVDELEGLLLRQPCSHAGFVLTVHKHTKVEPQAHNSIQL